MPDLKAVYQILRARTPRALPIRYSELSELYYQDAQERIDPHRGWSLPLLELLTWCDRRGLPQLPALVVNETGLPGPGFWGQANTPPTPSRDAWEQMRDAIRQADWPTTME